MLDYQQCCQMSRVRDLNQMGMSEYHQYGGYGPGPMVAAYQGGPQMSMDGTMNVGGYAMHDPTGMYTSPTHHGQGGAADFMQT